MCNLYSITNQAAIAALFRVVNRYAARTGGVTALRKYRAGTNEPAPFVASSSPTYPM